MTLFEKLNLRGSVKSFAPIFVREGEYGRDLGYLILMRQNPYAVKIEIFVPQPSTSL